MAEEYRLGGDFIITQLLYDFDHFKV